MHVFLSVLIKVLNKTLCGEFRLNQVILCFNSKDLLIRLSGLSEAFN